MKLDITKIVQNRLSKDQFLQEEHKKKQIYLHHTAGGGNPIAVAKYFEQKEGKVATAFVIGEKGTIVQLFSSKHWAYHLGLKPEVFSDMGITYQSLDKISIGIEICNYGPLKKQNGYFVNYVGGRVDRSQVTELNGKYKGHIFWQKYTDAQIESTRQLLVYLCDTYGISKQYFDSIFDIDKRALKGENGIFTHNSVRHDKSDIYPCPRMIEMLKNL
jgi:N-acetyl-anhydromuramyl-L-alanine amidase AmpD